MSEAENAFLHVYLDHVQPKSWSQDCTVTFGQIQNWTVQESEVTVKCLFQDSWLKNSAHQEWVLKDKLDKHYAVVMVLTKSNIGRYKFLFGSSPRP